MPRNAESIVFFSFFQLHVTWPMSSRGISGMDLLSIAVGDTLTTLSLIALDGYSWSNIRGM